MDHLVSLQEGLVRLHGPYILWVIDEECLSDPVDFPALGSHQPHVPNSNSTYAAQAQPATTSSQQHAQLQQQLFMQQQMGGLAPPPPPGIGGSATSPSQSNGLMGESLRGEDFPALGTGADGKDRV